MGTRSYRFVEQSSGTPEQVFALLADGARWSRWAGPLIVNSWWEREGDPAPGGVGAIRGLGTKQVGSREEIVAYDAPRHMGYIILSGAPVRGYRADVTLEPQGTGTRITWEGSYTPANSWSAPVVHLVLTRTVHGLCKRLAKTAGKTA